MEWELSGQEWVDQHPHAEFNYVLEGTLFVEAGGEAVEVPAGSLVEVRGGLRGRYRAPVHARMLAIYGPNPDGAPSTVIGLRSLPTLDQGQGPAAGRVDRGRSDR